MMKTIIPIADAIPYLASETVNEYNHVISKDVSPAPEAIASAPVGNGPPPLVNK